MDKRVIGFSYFDVQPGYEFIQGKIGFDASERRATVQPSNTSETVYSETGGQA